jgi:hypothetical protein
MPNSHSPVDIELSLTISDKTDDERLDLVTRSLLNELVALDLESIALAHEPKLPVGAKGDDLVTLGAIAVVALPTALPALLHLIQAWLTRERNRTVKIKLQDGNKVTEVEFSSENVSPEELQTYISALTGGYATGNSTDE